jgi:hypothetical protein
MLIAGGVLFVHAPKTAGTSVVEYLVKNLPGEKILTMPPGHVAQKGTQTVPGTRHETLAQAIKVAEGLGFGVDDFSLLLAVTRNPYDLEVSRYAYLRLGHPWDRGRPQEIALTGDFDRFCREAGYPWGHPTPIERWYTLDGHVPSNMRLLRFEHLDGDLAQALSPISAMRYRLKHRNATNHVAWRSYINAENEAAIYEKFRWLFQYYERVRVTDLATGGNVYRAPADVADAQ